MDKKISIRMLLAPVKAMYNLITNPDANFRATSEHLSFDLLIQKAIEEIKAGAKSLPEKFNGFENISKTGITGDKAIEISIMFIVKLLSEVKAMPLELRHLAILMIILDTYSETDLPNIVSQKDADDIAKVLKETSGFTESLLKALESGDMEKAKELITKIAGEGVEEFDEIMSPDPTLRAKSVLDEARKMLKNDK